MTGATGDELNREDAAETTCSAIWGAHRTRKPRGPLRQAAGDCPAPSTPPGYAGDGPSVLNPGVHSVDVKGESVQGLRTGARALR